MKIISILKKTRRKLKLSQREFAKEYHQRRLLKNVVVSLGLKSIFAGLKT
jgi:hypothetical protein